ncbi:MAG: FecR domain-containing protein [Verrucomicrobiota bacterium]
MNAPRSNSSDNEALRAAAAQWTVRRDRGLSAAESIEFELWLAADPRHAAAMKRSAGAWSLLDRVPDLAAQRELTAVAERRTRRRRVLAFGTLAAMAAAAVVLFSILPASRSSQRQPAVAQASAPALVAAGPREVELADGTQVKLNAGSEVVEDFDLAERRVRLTRGEAHFTVTKDPSRPFIVIAGALRVRAVGTAFNVNFQSSRVEVLVTEGRVKLATDTPASTAAAPASAVASATGTASTSFSVSAAASEADAAQPQLGAGERAVLLSPTFSSSSAASAPAPVIVVTRVDAAEISRTLAWHENLVRLGGATLAELAAEFERRFGQTVRIADPEIALLRAGGRVRGDDPEGFANLLATTFDLEVERASDGAWVLRKKKSDSR